MRVKDALFVVLAHPKGDSNEISPYELPEQVLHTAKIHYVRHSEMVRKL